MAERGGYVYIMTNKPRGTLYVGETCDLVKRVWEHRNGAFDNSFTNTYKLHRLVYFEHADELMAAVRREKQLKRYRRQWKIELIESVNPLWQDLYPNLL